MMTASLGAIMLSGCAVGPDFVRPAPPSVTQYTPEALPATTASTNVTGGDAQRFLKGQDVPGEWWTTFKSKALDTMVQDALKANPDLDGAQAALREAEENYYAAQGPLFPSLNASGSASRQKSSPQNGGGLLNLYNASVSISYVLDVFGGTRRSVEASRAAAENQRYLLEATYLTLISNVLTAAIQEASLSAQIAAQQEIISVQSQALDLINQQFQLGAVARGDVLAQQAQLNQTQANLPNLQKQLAQVHTQLAILLGRFPADGQVPDLTLDDFTLPTDLPLSLPSRLVNDRPDVRSAEAQLHQASAQIGIATANMLPQFTLSGSVSSSTNSAAGSDALFNPNTIAWNIASGLTAPIFRGGQLSHERQAALYAYDRAVAQYKSTVLTAFANVANVLHALELDADALKAQQLAEETAKQSLDITTERFRAGAIAYLPLLDAQRTYQQARIALAQAQANRFADTVALFQALGGGWWNRKDVIPSPRSEPLPLP